MKTIQSPDGMLNRVIHTHQYKDKGDHFACVCGKRKLKLEETEEGVRVGIRRDGREYHVRDHRDRYFFPEDWNKFYATLKDKNKPLFDFLIQTGTRINEALHARPSDFDFQRNTIRLWKTKTRAKLGERSGKPRTISLSPAFMLRVKKYIKKRGVKPESHEYLFVSNNKTNKQYSKSAASKLFNQKLEKAGLNPRHYSLHNIRKTHGNWCRALGVPAEEICLRLGHDFETYLKHYGSSSVFNEADIIYISRILEGLYSPQMRRF